MTEQITHEKSRKAGRLRRSAALAGILLASGGVVETGHAQAAGKVKKPPKIETISRRMHKVSELPGFKMNVKPEQKEQLKQSTVVIAKRRRSSDTQTQNPWYENCTGLKVSLPGQTEPYILTATHCFQEATGDVDGFFNDPINPTNKAESFIGFETQDLAVADPGISTEARLIDPIATVDSLVAHTAFKDISLLHAAVNPDAPPALQPGERSFEQIPALALKPAFEPGIPGEQVALYGVPEAGGYQPVIGTGRYIGRMQAAIWREGETEFSDANIIAHTPLDVVVINPQTPENDNCNYGSSGATGMLADGRMLPSLHGRINGGYGPDHVLQGGYSHDSREMNASHRAFLESYFGIDLHTYSTICYFNVLDQQTVSDMLAGANVLPPNAKG